MTLRRLLMAVVLLAATGGCSGGGGESAKVSTTTTSTTSSSTSTTATVVVSEANARVVVDAAVVGHRQGKTAGEGASKALGETLQKSPTLGPAVGRIESQLFMKLHAGPPMGVFISAVVWKARPAVDVIAELGRAVGGTTAPEQLGSLSVVLGADGWWFAFAPRSTYAIVGTGQDRAHLMEVAGAIAASAPA